jgi:hypothetical protein
MTVYPVPGPETIKSGHVAEAALRHTGPVEVPAGGRAVPGAANLHPAVT